SFGWRHGRFLRMGDFSKASLALRRARGKARAPGGSHAFTAVAALWRRYRQQRRNAAAADIVDAREHDIVALDFHQHRRGEALAVEFAERHGEVGRAAVPADREVGAERHLRGTLRPTDCDLPLPPLR